MKLLITKMTPLLEKKELSFTRQNVKIISYVGKELAG